MLTARVAVPRRKSTPGRHRELAAAVKPVASLRQSVESHGGELFALTDDVLHAEFHSAAEAIACAKALVDSARGDSAHAVSIGISLNELHGSNDERHGVALDNADALADIARPNEIVVSGAVREQIVDREDLALTQLSAGRAKGVRITPYLLHEPGAAASLVELFQELVRRRVFRAAGAYILVAWILVQVASIVFPEFDAPAWSMRVLIVMLTVGFPLAVLLAWTIDITARGFEQTPESRLSRSATRTLRLGSVAAAAVMAAGVLWWVWSDYLEPTTQRPSRAAVKPNPIVAVGVPTKTAGPDDIDWLGDGVANLLRTELAESRHVIVLSQSRWNAIAAAAASPGEARTRARRAGVDYLITGNYLQSPGGIVFNASLEDLENETVIYGGRLDEDTPGDVIAGTARLATGIKQALKVPLQENVSRFAADFAVANMDAYELYIAGLGYLVDFDYDIAEQSFIAALDIAPEFHMARFRLAEVMQATGRSEAARRELDAIPADAELTERERLFIAGAKAKFVAGRDPERSLEIYRELVEQYPYDLEAGQHLGDAYWVNYDDEAAIAVFRRLTELHGYDPSSWMALGERLLDVGELDEAEDALIRYVGMAPDDHYAAALLGNLAQLRGDVDASIGHYRRSLELKQDFAVAQLGLARSEYLRGDVDTAEALWRGLIGDERQAAGFRIDAAFDLAGVLRGRHRYADAIAVLRDVEAPVVNEGLREAALLSMIGLLHLDLDETDRARALINASIAKSPGTPTRYLFARGLLELDTGNLGQLEKTISEIRALALPADDPDRTEDKAADYLRGLSALAKGALETAGSALMSAVDADGYDYAMYLLGLARYQRASGDLALAEATAATAMSARDPGDLRLDLELDRTRAAQLHAAIRAERTAATGAR